MQLSSSSQSKTLSWNRFVASLENHSTKNAPILTLLKVNKLYLARNASSTDPKGVTRAQVNETIEPSLLSKNLQYHNGLPKPNISSPLKNQMDIQRKVFINLRRQKARKFKKQVELESTLQVYHIAPKLKRGSGSVPEKVSYSNGDLRAEFISYGSYLEYPTDE